MVNICYMKHKSFLLLIPALFVALGARLNAQELSNTMIRVTSPAFNQAERIPQKYTCDGSNANPTLQISDIPEGTRSLAVMVDDPDAPMGNFNHWIMWNISPDIMEISENSTLPGAITGINDAGKNGYVGPCPPLGTHRYIFRVIALNGELDLPETARKADLENAMQGKIIGEGELIGKYSR